ncbi:MAG: hypothetical protein ABSE99_13315 [Terracidiphilus sp.]|jgi:photosystem II stability/assembly factor-like uncharacterized protein
MQPIRLVLFLAVASIAAAQSPAPTVWQMQDSGTTAGLRGIDSVNGTIAWASGTGGTVLKTTDGGAHWQKCAVPDADKDGATLDFRGVQAWDATTAIVMASGPGEMSRLYKTTDGCRTWTLLYANPDKDGFWDSISVADRDNLMILGDPVDGRFSVFDTADGGKSWHREQDRGLQSKKEEGGFAASNSSLLVNWADGIAAFGTGSPSGAQLFRECDPCSRDAMWIVLAMPSFPKGGAAGIFSLNYRDWRRWIAVGGDYTKPNESVGTAAWSGDSGRHWIASTTPPHGYRSAVQWSESLKLWITAGTNGSDISRDDGKTWQPLDNGNWNALSLPFVVGPNGRIARLNPAAIPKP